MDTRPDTRATQGAVHTIKDRCRVCYTCVRECPAKAIRIVDGQAEVMAARCIACGNCVRVCSQGAKAYVREGDTVAALLAGGSPVVACVAPSFPAEFPDVDHRVVVGMMRALGFSAVYEVSFGADLVAREYRALLERHPERRYIATTCPAVVNYVERYFPESVDALAPVVSPMVAMARVVRTLHPADVQVVFVGPCIAKKTEARHPALPQEIDAALTFKELKELFAASGVDDAQVTPADFDPPHGGVGALFPVTRGMLQAAQLEEDLLGDAIVAADGLHDFVQAVSEFASGQMDARLLEVLSCNGCIMGPGMVSREPRFKRRNRVSRYVRSRLAPGFVDRHERYMQRFAAVDLTRDYSPFDQRIPAPSSEAIEAVLERMGKRDYADELNCGACGYASCRAHAVAILKGLAEDEMCLPYVIERLKETVGALSVSHAELASARDQLLHSEKLASMGQLAAGVAHELNNPLGVVMMYAHLLLDEIPADSPWRADLEMIAEQAQRGKRIVANLLDFARENKVALEEVHIEEVVTKAVHSVPKPDGVSVVFAFGHAVPTCEMDPDQMTQVFANVVANAYAAMEDTGGTLRVETQDDDVRVQFRFIDTGCGIPKENLSRIFQPFFTTKKLGRGTGLGLAVSYGIVKMHRGKIAVTSNADPQAGPTGTTFAIDIPKRTPSAQ